MQIIVNATARDITAKTLAAALAELGFADAAVATALNGQFVPRSARAVTPLAQGDKVEVLAPMQGG